MTQRESGSGVSRRGVLVGAGGIALGLAGSSGAGPLGVTPAHAEVAAADDITALRDRWRDIITGVSRIDPAVPEFATAITRLDNTAGGYLSLVDRTPGRTKVFTDLELAQTTDSSRVSTTYVRLRHLAIAWFTPGSRHHQSSAVLADVLAGLNTANVKVYNSTRAEFDNWWDWEIGSSRPLADCLVLLDEQLSVADRDRYAAAIQHFVPDPFSLQIHTPKLSTGANRVDLCQAALVQGIASRSTARIQRAADGLPEVCEFAQSGDGFYADGSFIQHTDVAYTGTYGQVLLSGMANLLALLAGSAWQVTDPAIANLIDMVELGYAPVMHDGRTMSFVSGRAISRESSTEQNLGHTTIAAILRLADAADPATAARWRAACRGWFDRCTSRAPFTSADVVRTALVSTLLNDATVTPAPEPERSVVFRNMARAVHRRKGWAFAISMCCDRIARYEVSNGENLKGFHTGAGMTYLYDDDNAQYSDHFWPTVDPYRLPGTTVDRKPIPDSGGQTNPTVRWAGGPVLDDRYSAVGMNLQAATTDLRGRKSWFCFDEYIVAMGSRITSTSGQRVETFIENRNLHATGQNALTVDGVEWPFLQNSSTSWPAARWAHLAGVAGYVFPDAGKLLAERRERTGSYRDIKVDGSTTAITRRYLTLWQDHGVDPTEATYSYLVVPKATLARTAQLADQPEVTLLANNATAQAVRQTGTGLTMVNFWVAATVANITVNGECGVIVQESAGRLKISVAQPIRTGTAIRVSVRPAFADYRLLTKDTTVTVAALGSTIILDVSPGTFGRSHVAEFTRP